jgi:hypothetical protein
MQENFKGIRNDLGTKHIGQEFVFDATNVNNDSIVGMDSILVPERAGRPNTSSIDGIVEYRYLDSALQPQQQTISISNGSIFTGIQEYNTLTATHMTYALEPERNISGVDSFFGNARCFSDWIFTADGETADVVINTPITQYNGNRIITGIPSMAQGTFFPGVAFAGNTTGTLNKALSPLKITSANHGLFDGDIIIITGTTNYNGQYTVFIDDVNNFTINAQFVADESATMIIKKSAFLYTGLQTGLCQFTTFNDKLLIVNGKDYPLWYNGATGNFYQMNAPEANLGAVGGVLNGTYQYAISFTTASGDDIFGTVSNTITTNGRFVHLTLPIPYLAATGGMKIYRTVAGGTQLKLLTTLTAPTPLFYDDNISDANLGADIGEINNEMVKPYFVESLFYKICMSVVDKYPTQVFIGEAGLEVLDPASDFIDLANQASDNTPIVGMEVDYNQLVLGTHRNIILIDPSQDVATITFTRSNIGVLNGYSMTRVPANGSFDGGVMFVSTLGDVRLISGYKNIIPNTVNDISTENMAQVISGTFNGMVRSAPNIFAMFYDYKYHLIVGEIMWIFDIRTQSWWKYDIRTTNYVSLPTCFGISGGLLYTGQTDGWIERMYSTIQYNGEDVVSMIESGTLTVNDAYKFMNNWQFWLYTSPNTEITIKMILDDDMANAKEATFSVGEGYFSPMYYSGIFYDTGIATEDYRNFNITRTARWVKFIITCTKGRLYFRGYNPNVEILRNKE